MAEYELSAFEEFTSWVLSFGPQAEVLEPAELREKLMQSLTTTMQLYAVEQPSPRTVRRRVAK